MRYDTLIIGAGFSGLAAGVRLAQFERQVAILEKHTLWGGLNSFYKLGGRLFDTGLHALTNFARPKTRGSPLLRILRQLRIPYAELELGEQSFSEILFPDARLTFSNDFGLLRSEVERCFPGQTDSFDRLVRELLGYDDFGGPGATDGARGRLAGYLTDPLLREMILCPALFYGSARERDMDWDLFCVLFRSIFLEGLARPEGGIRPLLQLLVSRFKQQGGELRMRSGVKRILVENGVARGVELEDGVKMEARQVLSSAGWSETQRLCGNVPEPSETGAISVLESICVLDRQPADIGYKATATFFNDSPSFDFARPEGTIDTRSGVVCTPNNYARALPLPEGHVRVSVLANFERWSRLPEAEYKERKQADSERALASAARFVPDVRPHTKFKDVFTPRTIQRFTGHSGGAIYGCPSKRRNAETGIDDLFVIGNDQGMVGIVGAMLSGITVANQRCLVSPAR
jgi:phytoene dehydrogenase-like protein